MIFSYKEYGEILRPVIPVKISSGGKSISYEVLVDSGSDKCFFDWEIGEIIGINTKNSELHEVFGVGGKISLYYTHPVTLTVGNISNEIIAGFIPKIGGGIVPYGLVGQNGFFDKFSVKFDLKNRGVEVISNL